jgi:hypothetical protein
MGVDENRGTFQKWRINSLQQKVLGGKPVKGYCKSQHAVKKHGSRLYVLPRNSKTRHKK